MLRLAIRNSSAKLCRRPQFFLLFVAGILLGGSAILLQTHATTPPSRTEIFSDVTKQAGINWRHFSGASPDRFLIETMGGGVAFLDFDGDRKSTRLNSSHLVISYAVFCLKKKKQRPHVHFRLTVRVVC